MVVSCVAKDRLSGTQAAVAVAPRLYNTGSLVVLQRFSYSMAGGIFQHQGSNLCHLPWQGASLPLSHQEGPSSAYLLNHDFPLC